MAVRPVAATLSIDGPESGDWAFQLFERKGPGGLVHVGIVQTPQSASGGIAVINASTDRGVAPLTIHLGAAVYRAQAGSITTYRWDFGDCSPVETVANPIHVFTKAGKFTVRLVAKDSTMQSDFGSQNVLVTGSDEPPTAMFTAATLDGAMPTTVSFDARSSYDIDGQLTSFEWNYGDWSTGNGNLATHRYLKWGSYPVTLKVTDNAGLIRSTCRMITTGEVFGLPAVPCPG